MVQRFRKFVAAAVKGGQSVARPLLREALKVAGNGPEVMPHAADSLARLRSSRGALTFMINRHGSGASRLQFESVREHDYGLRAALALVHREADGLRLVGEQPAAQALRVPDDPAPAMILPDEQAGADAGRRFDFRLLNHGILVGLAIHSRGNRQSESIAAPEDGESGPQCGTPTKSWAASPKQSAITSSTPSRANMPEGAARPPALAPSKSATDRPPISAALVATGQRLLMDEPPYCRIVIWPRAHKRTSWNAPPAHKNSVKFVSQSSRLHWRFHRWLSRGMNAKSAARSARRSGALSAPTLVHNSRRRRNHMIATIELANGSKMPSTRNTVKPSIWLSSQPKFIPKKPVTKLIGRKMTDTAVSRLICWLCHCARAAL